MSKTKKSSSIEQFRCQSCNAPYPLGADDVIATCPYCGYEIVPDFWVSQDYDMIMAVFGAKGLTDSTDREQWHQDRYKEQQERK